jgi:glycine cleavage system regulatory protein
VNLTERDIRTAAMVSESEQVNMGVESEDVEQSRAAALKAIEEAKGRIIESDLKKLEAGQFLARVTAEVKPDAAGPLIDRLKQIGRVARLEIERRQKSPEGTTVPPSGVRVERADTRLILSIYNLANVAPRVSTSLNLAAPDVETAYRAILNQIKSAGGRVVTSQLNRQGAAQTTGTITFESPADQADVLLGAVRVAGEVMKLDVQQNPDTQNTTDAKRGFAVQIYSLAAAAPRETTDIQIAAKAVADAFATLREAVRTAEGRVLTSQLAATDPTSATGQLVFEVSRQQTGAVEQALRQAGDAVSRNVNRAADTENTVDTKVRYSITLTDEARLTPRQTVELKLAVKDVQPSYAKLLEAIQTSGARVLQSQLASDQQANSVGGTLVFDVRGAAARAALEQALADAGDVYARNVTRSADAQGVVEDKTRLSVTIIDATRLPPRESTTIGVEVNDVERSKGGLEATTVALGGTSASTIAKERDGRTVAQLTLHVPLAKKAELLKAVRDQGKVLVVREESDANVPPGQFARARLSVTLGTPEQIVSPEDSLASSIRRGLGFSAQGLLWSLQWVIVGLCFVLPWVVVGWLIWRLVRRSRRRGHVVAEGPPPAPLST